MQIGRPALPDELVDRESEIDSIIKKLQSRTSYNLALIGHRRIGKSSILQKIADILSKDEKKIVIYFDIKKNLGDPRLFLTSLQTTIFNSYAKKIGRLGKAKIKASNIISNLTEIISSKRIKGIGLELRPGATPEDFSVMPKIVFEQKETAYAKLFESVFATANAIAEKYKVVIILDEFQDIIHLRRYKGLKNILDLFRGIIQERHKNVSFVICGSHVHMLRSILSDSNSPMFQHFVEIPINEMNEQNSIILFNEYLLGRGFSKNNKIAKEAFDLVGGQPYYLMAMAEMWEPKKDMHKLFFDSVTSSVGTLRLYAEYVLAEDVATAQGGPMLRAILEVLAKADADLGYSEIAKSLLVKAHELVPYINELIKTDLVVKTKSGYAIRDRIIREYLRLNSG
ncbi:MAG: ATP-binding protein [Candidatus Nitrosotenuis sp.]